MAADTVFQSTGELYSMEQESLQMIADVLCIATSGPGDVSGLASAISRGRVAADSIVAIMAKTEGTVKLFRHYF